MQNLVPGCALVGGPKILGTQCCHRGWPYRNTPLSACVTLPNVVVVGQTARMQLHWTARKIELLHSTFEVTQSRSANYDFLLVIRNNYENFFYRFRGKMATCKLFPACIFNRDVIKTRLSEMKTRPRPYVETKTKTRTRHFRTQDL